MNIHVQYIYIVKGCTVSTNMKWGMRMCYYETVENGIRVCITQQCFTVYSNSLSC